MRGSLEGPVWYSTTLDILVFVLLFSSLLASRMRSSSELLCVLPRDPGEILSQRSTFWMKELSDHARCMQSLRSNESVLLQGALAC